MKHPVEVAKSILLAELLQEAGTEKITDFCNELKSKNYFYNEEHYVYLKKELEELLK